MFVGVNDLCDNHSRAYNKGGEIMLWLIGWIILLFGVLGLVGIGLAILMEMK